MERPATAELGQSNSERVGSLVCWPLSSEKLAVTATEATCLEWIERLIFCQADNRRISRPFIDHPILHYETRLAKRFNFLSRIASNRDEVRQQGRADAAELVFHAEDL